MAFFGLLLLSDVSAFSSVSDSWFLLFRPSKNSFLQTADACNSKYKSWVLHRGKEGKQEKGASQQTTNLQCEAGWFCMSAGDCRQRERASFLRFFLECVVFTQAYTVVSMLRAHQKEAHFIALD